jgi:catechol 2,3-dioxygenase-like lactoylglutathione lyase family enzyme
MLHEIHPKLPMRDQAATKAFYTQKLGFRLVGEYPDYLLLRRDAVEIHFFAFKALNPHENYGQVYIRTEEIKKLYAELQANGVEIHPNSPLSLQPWGQWEFAILDPDHNLLTFGQEK